MGLEQYDVGLMKTVIWFFFNFYYKKDRISLIAWFQTEWNKLFHTVNCDTAYVSFNRWYCEMTLSQMLKETYFLFICLCDNQDYGLVLLLLHYSILCAQILSAMYYFVILKERSIATFVLLLFVLVCIVLSDLYWQTLWVKVGTVTMRRIDSLCRFNKDHDLFSWYRCDNTDFMNLSLISKPQ